MTAAQRRSAVRRKRAAGNPGGKPRNVKTIVRKKAYYKKEDSCQEKEVKCPLETKRTLGQLKKALG